MAACTYNEYYQAESKRNRRRCCFIYAERDGTTGIASYDAAGIGKTANVSVTAVERPSL